MTEKPKLNIMTIGQAYRKTYVETTCEVQEHELTDKVIPLEGEGGLESALIQAHMAGQYDAGVDPSYSNARAWMEEQIKSQIKEGQEDE